MGLWKKLFGKRGKSRSLVSVFKYDLDPGKEYEFVATATKGSGEPFYVVAQVLIKETYISAKKVLEDKSGSTAKGRAGDVLSKSSDGGLTIFDRKTFEEIYEPV